MVLAAAPATCRKKSRLRSHGAKGERGNCPIRRSAVAGGMFGRDWRPVCALDFYFLLLSVLCSVHCLFCALLLLLKNLQNSSQAEGVDSWAAVVCLVSQLCWCLRRMEQQISCSQRTQPKKPPRGADSREALDAKDPETLGQGLVGLDALIAKTPAKRHAKGCQGPPSRLPRRRLLCSARYARWDPATPRYQPNTVSFRTRTSASAGRASLLQAGQMQATSR